MSISDRFSQLLKTKQLTHEQWAELLNVSRQTVTDAANGTRVPQSKLLVPLRKLGYSIDWLLSGEGEMMIHQDQIQEAQKKPFMAPEDLDSLKAMIFKDVSKIVDTFKQDS